MLETRNTVTEIKNAFNGLISRLNIAEKESLSLSLSKLNCQNKRLGEKKLRIIQEL
jgi:hypothetical protein